MWATRSRTLMKYAVCGLRKSKCVVSFQEYLFRKSHKLNLEQLEKFELLTFCF